MLWAPWRLGYITGNENKGCIFCEKSASSDDRKNYVIQRGGKAFALLNLYPYNNGHTMVAPYEHTGELEDLQEDTYLEVMRLTRDIARRIREKMNPQGLNIGVNIGKAAGAGIDSHLHVHIVPRWVGDTNFMPVLSGDGVISESLDSVYEKLAYAKK